MKSRLLIEPHDHHDQSAGDTPVHCQVFFCSTVESTPERWSTQRGIYGVRVSDLHCTGKEATKYSKQCYFISYY